MQITAACPACQKNIPIEKGIKVQELTICPDCKSVLELISLSPPTLDWAEDPLFISSLRQITNFY